MALRINSKGLAAILAAGLSVCSGAVYTFIGQREGEAVYTAYADRLARNIPTVCRGLTHHVTDTPIIIGDVWSAAKCEAEEKRAITAVQSHLILCFQPAKPPQSVFDAGTSHAWNFGYPATCGSQAMQAWRTGNWALGCRRMMVSDGGKLVWVYADGQFVRGLANRRALERAFCERDVT